MREAELLDEAIGETRTEPAFFEDFWREAERRQRIAARRWRRTALALASLLVAAGTAAGVFASAHTGAGTVDQIWTCNVGRLGSANLVEVSGSVDTPRDTGFLRLQTQAQASVESDAKARGQFALFHRPDAPVFDTHFCTRGGGAIPLSPKGLVDNGVVTSRFVGSFFASCNAATRIVYRARVTITRGSPSRAVLAVRDARSRRPLGYVEWTPTRIASWFARACST
jgi:hypothetical protein